jgi:hypothetical protein
MLSVRCLYPNNVFRSIPSFWDGWAVAGYGGDFAAALDVGVSAVYSVGGMGGGATMEARRYVHGT